MMLSPYPTRITSKPCGFYAFKIVINPHFKAIINKISILVQLSIAGSGFGARELAAKAFTGLYHMPSASQSVTKLRAYSKCRPLYEILFPFIIAPCGLNVSITRRYLNCQPVLGCTQNIITLMNGCACLMEALQYFYLFLF